jgi:hypothetical protein
MGLESAFYGEAFRCVFKKMLLFGGMLFQGIAIMGLIKANSFEMFGE